MSSRATFFAILFRRVRPDNVANLHCKLSLLRARCERPRGRRTAECSQQFPPSDGDCHTPLPCEVRKGNDTTPRVCSLAVHGGRMLVASTSVGGLNYSRRQL